MTRYSDDELRAILTYVQSDLTLRISFWTDALGKKARKAICAFANDLPNAQEAGVLIIGANDDGSPNPDFVVDDQLLLTISDIATDGQLVPPPAMYVEARELNGHTYAIAVVEPSDSTPVRFDGRIWIRIGPREAIANAQDERILNEKRQHGDMPADLKTVSTTTWENVNLTRFRLQYLPAAFAKTVLDANERTDIQRLISLKLIESASPHRCTIAGCLALVDDATWHIPGAYIQWLKIAGNSITDSKTDEVRGQGDIKSAIDLIDARLFANIPNEITYADGNPERRFSPYPIDALKELVRNAVMHRTYPGGNAPVHVYWYNDRIEITNPGGPYGDVTVENFGKTNATGYRNPNIAETMKVLGLVQRFGSGIKIAQKLCADNGNPPIQFEVSNSYVKAIVRPAVRPW